ncbi:hypothetical protein G3M48_001895, partial [Beauveria asiatica]
MSLNDSWNAHRANHQAHGKDEPEKGHGELGGKAAPVNGTKAHQKRHGLPRGASRFSQ